MLRLLTFVGLLTQVSASQASAQSLDMSAESHQLAWGSRNTVALNRSSSTATRFHLPYRPVATRAPEGASQLIGTRLAGEAAAIGATLTGPGPDNTADGWGYDFQLGIRVNSLSVEAGYQDLTLEHQVYTDTRYLYGPFIEARQSFRLSLVLYPFLTARAGYLKHMLESDTLNPLFRTEAEGDGFIFGGGGGLSLLLGPVGLDFSLYYSRLLLGEMELDGDLLPDSDLSASSFAGRLGLSFLVWLSKLEDEGEY